ncbi:uncharacterized protein [Leptinotarsa decemlineata]|uniref:uncharacterized protein n=1 Tax=Leptinotarsa decemlineata TaxID=7539 RepID=UPI003D306950
MVLIEFLVISWISCASGDADTNTVRTYTLDVPGSDPIQIFEGDPLWETRKGITKPLPYFDSSTFTTIPTTNINIPVSSEKIENTSEFTPSGLRDFLDTYAEKLKVGKPETVGGASRNPLTEEKGKKSWDLVKVRHHNHPYDDKNGWVSLDAIPWSVSKISKWKSKPEPVKQYWNNKPHIERPQQGGYDEFHISTSDRYNPQVDTNKYQIYYLQESQPNHIRPSFSKPPTPVSDSLHSQLTPSFYRKPEGYNQQEEFIKRAQHCNHGEEESILTDGQPPNFPKREFTNRRLGAEPLPPNHPFTGNGEWVLLSASTGYKYPKKQRSMRLNSSAINTHKSVHLTVLPPAKGSKVNMTTSHGGILQVESTFESVEQSQKKQQKLQKLKRKQKRPTKLVKKRKPPISKVVTESAIVTVPRSTGNGGDSSAVLAGVGAGLIPATMAMLVPLAMNGGRKRKKREIFTDMPTSIDISLQSYF